MSDSLSIHQRAHDIAMESVKLWMRAPHESIEDKAKAFTENYKVAYEVAVKELRSPSSGEVKAV